MICSPGEVTRLLKDLEARKHEAAPRLFELLYDELHRMAKAHLRKERPDHTLQATELLHEAYFRLVVENQNWRSRAHFLAIASAAMRRILVDYARARSAAKRPSSQQRVDLEATIDFGRNRFDEVIAIDLALKKLAEFDPRQADIVQLRYFGGLTAEEVAEALDVSVITVQRDWAVAKAWLFGELSGLPAGR